MDAAKRYRVDTEKLQKAVTAEFVAKRGKKPKAKSDGVSKDSSLGHLLESSGGVPCALRLFFEVNRLRSARLRIHSRFLPERSAINFPDKCA
jgi:hypothetical protein